MPFLSLLGGIYFLFIGISGKGRAYKSKMGTPLSEKEIRTVKLTYVLVGILLLIVTLISGIELIFG